MNTRNTDSRQTSYLKIPLVLNLFCFSVSLLLFFLIVYFVPCTDFFCWNKFQLLLGYTTAYLLFSALLNGFLYRRNNATGLLVATVIFGLLFLLVASWLLILLFL